MPLASLAGCAKPANESLEAFLKQAGPARANIFPLAGKVTIDGQPPHLERPDRLLVMLTDPSKPDSPRRLYRQCDDEGNFAFTTFVKGDGVPAGTYVVTFAVLKLTPRGFVGPDQLKNLYNDPERNAENRDFNIAHQSPGKTDYAFDLKLAGLEGLANAGAKALTELRM